MILGSNNVEQINWKVKYSMPWGSRRFQYFFKLISNLFQVRILSLYLRLKKKMKKNNNRKDNKALNNRVHDAACFTGTFKPCLCVPLCNFVAKKKGGIK